MHDGRESDAARNRTATAGRASLLLERIFSSITGAVARGAVFK